MRPALIALAHLTHGYKGSHGFQGTRGSHGLRDLDGPEVIAHLLDDVRRRLPGVDVLGASVEVIAPGVPEVMPGIGAGANIAQERSVTPSGVREVMSGRGGPAVVVPLFLSGGDHVTTDLPAAVGMSGASVHVAGPLGPDRYLARVLAARLREAGALFGDAVVLAAAGSEDPAAQVGAEQAADLLRSEWGPRVTLAFVPGPGPHVPAVGSDVSAAGPDLPAAVELLRQAGAKRVCVAPYVLLPGRFASRVTALASAAGATSVAPVLGRHRLVADLVVLRYQEGLSVLAATPHLAAGSLSDTDTDAGPSAQLLVSNQ